MALPTEIKPSIVLASSSVYRRELLARLMIEFFTHSPDIDESPKPNESSIELVERLAVEKARAVASHYPDALIIGSDQVAMHGKIIVGKPHTHANAVAQLHQASGKQIDLYTGLALLDARTNTVQSEVVKFSTHFKPLSENTIEQYLRKEKPYDCAGSLKSEGLGIALLERFEGDDPTALIGLPLIRLTTMLANAGFNLFD